LNEFKGTIMRKFLNSFILVLFLGVTGYVFYTYWSMIFSKTIKGVITDVERVNSPTVVVGGGFNSATNKEMFSYAVAIKQKDGDIATASSEDRQWAVAQKGLCAEARFYPYPPWDFEKAGTYFNARLIRLYVCEEGKIITEKPTATPDASTKPPSPVPDTSTPPSAAMPTQPSQQKIPAESQKNSGSGN
jgi:hypothetical protein